MVSVMDGRDALGFLLQGRAGCWYGLNAAGIELGEFPNRESARAAVVKVARATAPGT
jgi:hypothetical protein